MIDAAAVAALVGGLGACWAAGFAVGKSVAYVRAIFGAL